MVELTKELEVISDKYDEVHDDCRMLLAICKEWTT